MNSGTCDETDMSAFSGKKNSAGVATCDYNYKAARFYSEGESDGYKGQGYMITYTSEQPCTANPDKPMVYRFIAICDQGG